MFLDSLKYSLHIMIHPFDGFWDMKYEKKGSLRAAVTLVLLLIITRIVKRQTTGFIFNDNDIKTLNIAYEFRIVVISLLLWCIANWCLTTLMDGEGSFKDIFMATAYAMTPMIIVYLPLTLISNFLLTEEKEFFVFFDKLALVWFCWLLWIGIMIVHQYSVKKTVLTIFLTLAGMGVIIFLGLLFINLFDWMYSFVDTVIKEIVFRL